MKSSMTILLPVLLLFATALPSKAYVSATEVDDDILNLVTEFDTIDVPEGSTGIVNVRLSIVPGGDVNVSASVASGDPDITIQSGSTLAFTTTNWFSFQPVTMAAAQDDDAENGMASLNLSATGVSNASVTVREVDSDILGILVSPNTLNVPEGSTGQVQVSLTAEPTGTVQLSAAVISGDQDLTVQAGSNPIFNDTNWNVLQFITIAAVEDLDAINGYGVLRVAGSGLIHRDIDLYEEENDSIPLVPAFINASDGIYSDRVIITWYPNWDALEHNIYRSTISGGPWVLIGTTIGEEYYFDDTSAIADSIYYYSVTAVNVYGESDHSLEDSGWRELNFPPVTQDENFDASEDTPLSIPAPGVLTNDTDPDAHSLSASLYSHTGHIQHLSLFGDGSFYLVPESDYYGPISFTYYVYDGHGDSDTAIATVEVANINDPPDAFDDFTTTIGDQTILIDVLSNDNDIDGDQLTISSVTQGSNGSVINNVTSISYIPNVNFTGPDSFTYTVQDVSGLFDTAVVNVTISPPSNHTIVSTATTGGYISPSGSVSVIRGDDQSFSISPDPNYLIDDVVVDGVSQGNISSYTFTNVTANHQITASFLPANYTITADVSPIGSGSVTGAGTYAYGSTATLAASAEDCYQFAEWTGPGFSTDENPVSLTVLDDMTVTANFALQSYTVTASVSPSGAGTVTGSGTYPCGTEVTLMASATNSAYEFSTWSGDASGMNSSVDITVDSDKSVTAHFGLRTYTISATAGSGGSIALAGSIDVTHGGDVTFTMTPDTNYEIENVLVDDASQGPISNYTFANVASDGAIYATFQLIERILTTAVSPAGGGSVTGAGTYTHGENVVLTALEAPCYQFSYWSGDASGTDNPLNVITDADKRITANFVLRSYTVNANAAPADGGSVSGDGSYQCGTDATLIASPASGYAFSMWSGDASGTNATVNITVDSDKNVTAHFSLICTDSDNDGYYAEGGGCGPADCNDAESGINQSASEVCNNIDDDCNGLVDDGALETFYYDLDNDGYGDLFNSVQACPAPMGYVDNSLDCDDNNSDVHPTAAEACNGIDDNCDGNVDDNATSTFYYDSDDDGYGNPAVTVEACTAPIGYVATGNDCDDGNIEINPDTTWYRDGDNDGYSDFTTQGPQCSRPVEHFLESELSSLEIDCDDSNSSINPGATEIPGNGLDDDCEKSTLDEDGYIPLIEDWEVGYIDTTRWIIFGTPIPSIETHGFSSTWSLDPQGDGQCESGVITPAAFSLEDKVLSFDAKIATIGTLLQSVIVGFTPVNIADDPCAYDSSDVPVYIYVSGENHGNTFPPRWVNYTIDNESYAEEIDDSWHNFKAVFESNGQINFYMDDVHAYTSSTLIDYSSYPLQHLLISGYSIDGPVYVDNIILTTLDAGFTSPGQNVVVAPVDPATGESSCRITFQEVVQGGNTNAHLMSDHGQPPVGFRLGTPPVYFDISTTAAYLGTVEVCLDYSGIQFGSEDRLKLFHRSGSGQGWEDITASLDFTADIICGLTTSLSDFAVFEAEGTSTGGSGGGGGGGCFIATAAYGSYDAPVVKVLRDFRDKRLLTNRLGTAFTEVYYKHSPPAARWLEKHGWSKPVVQLLLLPLVLISWLVVKVGWLGLLLVVLTVLGVRRYRLREV